MRLCHAAPSKMDQTQQRTIAQHPPLPLSESATSLVPSRVLRQLYTILLRFQLVAPHLRLPVPSGRSFFSQACLLAEITAVLCAGKHDRLLNTGVAARLAQGESFAEVLKNLPEAAAVITTEDPLPSGIRSRASLDQFAATSAFISKLRGEECVFFTMLGRRSLDKEFRQTLRACGESRLPVLFYLETQVDVSGKPSARNSMDLSSIYAEFGVPVITTDVHDPIALYRVTTEAIHNARFGRGTTVIESVRVVAENQHARLATADDPLEFVRNYMKIRGTWDDSWGQAQRQALTEELKSAFGESQAEAR